MKTFRMGQSKADNFCQILKATQEIEEKLSDIELVQATQEFENEQDFATTD